MLIRSHSDDSLVHTTVPNSACALAHARPKMSRHWFKSCTSIGGLHGTISVNKTHDAAGTADCASYVVCCYPARACAKRG